MLRLRPCLRIASTVPSTSSFRRSTLCWCQRRLRPSAFVAAGGICSANSADSHSLERPSIVVPAGHRRGMCSRRPGGVGRLPEHDDPLARGRSSRGAWKMVSWHVEDGVVVHRADPLPAVTRPARASLAESFAGADPQADDERRRALRRMKVVALSFLIGATCVFLACRWAQSQGAAPIWVGYVGAAAEAGMVGALADWFAVTALFKHPLGIPIPHTAIIKRKKDQLGEGLGAFVRENFLSAEVVETKLRDAQVPGRLGKWLSDISHAERVANETATVLRVLVELLRDDDVQQVIDRMIVRRIAEPQWGPPVGRVLATLLAENRQEALIQLLADRAFQWSLNAGEVIQRVVERDSPTWSPRFVDHMVGDRIHRELMDFTDKVRRNPDHELRRSATRFLFEFADDLQHDPDTIARADAIKEQLMAR